MTQAVIDKSARSIRAVVECASLPLPAEQEALEPPLKRVNELKQLIHQRPLGDLFHNLPLAEEQTLAVASGDAHVSGGGLQSFRDRDPSAEEGDHQHWRDWCMEWNRGPRQRRRPRRGR